MKKMFRAIHRSFVCCCVLCVFSCSSQSSELKKIIPLYKIKGKPKPGDWLSVHDEEYYDLARYISTGPSRPDSLRRIIYIYKLGATTSAEDSLLNITASYLECVFHLKTKIAGTFPVSCVPDSLKRGSDDFSLQVYTHFVLDTLVNLPLPKDAAMAICFTRYDLYPDPDWNFVFGQAYLQERVGVWSFNRFGDANNPAEFKTVLKRTLKVASHETGHMFSIKHCVRYDCNLNGSNSLEERDEHPLYFCPDCLEKLSWNEGFSLLDHFIRLQAFYERYGFAEEAKFMKKNIRSLKGN